jgi:[acyl-carrier-protein] S-malonyltransferase
MPGRPSDPQELAYSDWLRERLMRYLGHPVEETVPFAEYGLDSVAALSLYGDIEEEFGPLIEPTDVWAYPTVRELSRYLTLRSPRPGAGDRVRAAFVFGGQGAQHPGMASGLYVHSASYRASFDEAAVALLPYTGMSMVDLVLSGDTRVHQTAFTQPAVFAVEYALARTLSDAGIEPVAVLGHGIGEFAAAVAAGALSLPDAAKLVSLRGAFMQYLPSTGGMMASCASVHEAMEQAAAEPEVYLSVVNAARATVFSGDRRGLERVQGRLEACGIACVHLPLTHPFHSPLMAPVVPKFQVVARRTAAAAPRLPYYSAVHGRRTDETLHEAYWSKHITAPVRFADAAHELMVQQQPSHVVEIGPRVVLTPYLRRMGGRSGPACLPVCRGSETNAVDLAGVLSQLDGGPLAPELTSRT